MMVVMEAEHMTIFKPKFDAVFPLGQKLYLVAIDESGSMTPHVISGIAMKGLDALQKTEAKLRALFKPGDTISINGMSFTDVDAAVADLGQLL
jgi:hypothetical protein